MNKLANLSAFTQCNCCRNDQGQNTDPPFHMIHRMDTENQWEEPTSTGAEIDQEHPSHFTDLSAPPSRLRAGAATDVYQSDIEGDLVDYQNGRLTEPQDEEYKSILSNLRRIHHFARKGWGLSVMENEYDFEEEDLPMRKTVVTVSSRSNFSPVVDMSNITAPRIYVDPDNSMPLARVARQRGLPENASQYVTGGINPSRRAAELNNQRRRAIAAEAERQAALLNVKNQRYLALAAEAAREEELELQRRETQQRESQNENAANLLLQRKLAENAIHEKRKAAAEELQRRRHAAIEHERTMTEELEASMATTSCPYRKRGGGTGKQNPQVRWDNRKYFEGHMPVRMGSWRVQGPQYTRNRRGYNLRHGL